MKSSRSENFFMKRELDQKAIKSYLRVKTF